MDKKLNRPKRTKQYTKEELEKAIDVHGYSVNTLSEILGIKEWSLRRQLKEHGLYQDYRKYSNLDRTLGIPTKEVLLKMYHDDNMTLLEMSKKLGASNVTVRKWFRHHNIELLSHSDTIKLKVVPKIIKYNREKYGVEHFYQTNEFQRKCRDTCIDRYGIPYYHMGNTSNAELEVLDYFNSLKPLFLKSHKFDIELDGYNEDLKVAFEYCGLYWHRESSRGKNLHHKKYTVCLDNNIRLFTIFEDEWLYKNDQVKSFIKASLNMNKNKIYARKLKILRVDKKDIQTINFINDYHIQGSPNLNNTLCHFILTDGNHIFSAMSFSKHHRNNKEIILSRYCVKSDYTIIGGSSKLFKHAKDYFKCSIKTWSDNRWTEGNMYKRLGFTLYKELPKDYSYISLNGKVMRKSKQSMKKSKIDAKPNQTEYQRALEIGFDRIWDCGKKTWIYE